MSNSTSAAELGLIVARIVALLGVPPLGAAGPAAAAGLLEAKVDVLLAVEANVDAGQYGGSRGGRGGGLGVVGLGSILVWLG
jgi:hypothetical protein